MKKGLDKKIWRNPWIPTAKQVAMLRIRTAMIVLLISAMSVYAFAQQKSGAQTSTTETRDVDPLALDVLKAVAQPLAQAPAFSFKGLISEEQLATNGQIVTFFHTVEITVQRPDKAHLVFQGRGQRVDFYGTSGSITMYSPDAKTYATMPAKATVDENVTDLMAKGFDIPIGPFLSTHLYDIATKNLMTAYVVGRVKIYDHDAHQVVFTAPSVDWQLWATGGDAPRVVRVESVSKNLPGKPRTIVQFLDWNLNPTISANEFTFTKPADVQRVDMLLPKGRQ
jgi:hypothetical protein